MPSTFRRTFLVLATLLQLSFSAWIFPDEFDVLSYNIYIRPIFQDGQTLRARYLMNQLGGYDAIVFQEAYDDDIRDFLLAGLKNEYPFSTRTLGENRFFGEDGGVLILSKWPIVREGQRVFTDGDVAAPRCPGPNCCAGSDCYADKGVVYALIEKTGQCYHLFGTHVQAGRDNAALRNEQFEFIADFIESQRIPNDEPVIIAGDMNVNRYDEARFADVQRSLNAKQPQLNPTAPPMPGLIYTFDGPGNDVNDNEGARAYVDYVLYSVDHALPTDAFNQVRIIRAPEPWRQYFWQDWRRDLSDHYAVLGHFVYPGRPNVCR